MNIVLHIGSPKTGSSSIQKFFSSNQETLARAGVIYPQIETFMSEEKVTRQVGFRFAMCVGAGHPEGLAQRFSINSNQDLEGFSKNYLEEFLALIRNNKKKNMMIISDEALFLYSNEKMVSNAHDFIRRHFDDVKIIGYLRNHRDYFRSFYSQRIKMGGTESFQEYVHANVRDDNFSSKLSHWRNNFGSGAVQLIPFRSETLKGQDVVTDFLERIGLSEISSPPIKLNQSLNEFGCEVLKFINIRYKKDGATTPRLLRKLIQDNFFGNSPDFDAAIFASVEEFFVTDLKELQRNFGLSSDDIDLLRSIVPRDGEGAGAFREGKRNSPVGAENTARAIIKTFERRNGSG